MLVTCIFIPFKICFQMALFLGALNGGIVRQNFPKQSLVFTYLQSKSFENIAGKGEIARDEQFLLFQQRFLHALKNFLPFSSNLKISSAKIFGFGRV